MILGIGSDICDIRRIEKAIERHGDRFLNASSPKPNASKAMRRTETIQAATFAKRFAAKEAAPRRWAPAFAAACSSPIWAWSICRAASRRW